MIKVTVGEQKTQSEKPFPKLMKLKSNGKLYYFYRKTLGLPLEEPERAPDKDLYGKWASGWEMDSFEDYNEPITIQNV